MYRVVGCSECTALWVIEGRPDTSECPRCGSRRSTETRRTFFKSDDADEAREARSRLLAERQGAGEAFASVSPFGELEDALDEAGPDDETYLAESGIDPDAVTDAGERAAGGRSRKSREATVREAIRETADPDEAAIQRYCEARGVPREAAATLLEKLVRSGEVARDGDTYRLL